MADDAPETLPVDPRFAAAFDGVPWREVLADIAGLRRTGVWPRGCPDWAKRVDDILCNPVGWVAAAEQVGIDHVVNCLLAERGDGDG